MAADGLLLRGAEVSLDGGATWDAAEFSPPLEAGTRQAEPRFSGVAVLPAGGFMATMSGAIPAGGGAVVWVLLSDDGRIWTPVLGPGIEGCESSPQDTAEPAAAAEEPVLAGDRAFVAFNCPGAAPGLFVISGGDADVRVLDRVPQGRRLGRPFAHAGHVIVPVGDLDYPRQLHGFVVADAGG